MSNKNLAFFFSLTVNFWIKSFDWAAKSFWKPAARNRDSFVSCVITWLNFSFFYVYSVDSKLSPRLQKRTRLDFF